jgi:drug/metabolite transporter (DMT)-like permease
MLQQSTKPASSLLVIIAFAIVYLVWGSTYFFIRMAVQGGIPPFILGAIRFTTAGLLLMAWCLVKKEKIFVLKDIVTAAVSGALTLLIGIGVVIWTEQTLPSAMVAILVSSAPIWFILLDKPNWSANFKNKAIIAGLAVGFGGVMLLFSEQLKGILASNAGTSKLAGMALLLVGSIAWSAGSLYSKAHPSKVSVPVSTAWQMILAGIFFVTFAAFNGELKHFDPQLIPASSWFSLGYLVLFGSIAAYSAYVWLLQVRPATQVSTYAYVNPVIAVILGMVFAGEAISITQIAGLLIILASVLLINMAKYSSSATKVKKVATA